MARLQMIRSVILCLVLAVAAISVIPCAALEQLWLHRCCQSSVSGNATCDKANNKFIDGTEPESSCSQLSNETGGWWRAMTTQRAFIELIRIYNRVDCCMDSLTDFTVTVDGVECIEYSSEETFTHRTFTCERTGHVIHILSKTPNLTLCEVQAFGEDVNDDYLLRGPTCTSTFVNGTKGKLECRDLTNYRMALTPAEACTIITPNREHSIGWWKVEFSPRKAFIKTVLIHNLINPASGRSINGLSFFNIYRDGEYWLPCVEHQSRSSFLVKSFNCHGIGSSVTVTDRRRNAAPCEVEVFGKFLDDHHGRMLSLEYCNQSSTLTTSRGSTTIYECANALDNRMYPPIVSCICCTSTASANGWWKASTRERAFVTLVNIYNTYLPLYYRGTELTSTGLNSFVISVNGVQCAEHDSAEYWLVKPFDCNQMGQVVQISSSASTNLVICEVQVFGFYVDIQEKLAFTGCSQSSVAAYRYEGQAVTLHCHNALNGVTAENMRLFRCSEVMEPMGWWRVQLSGWVYIGKIRIYPRYPHVEALADGLNHFQVTVDQLDRCILYRSFSKPFATTTFDCDLIGSSVKIESLDSAFNSRLILCEVQLFGQRIEAERQLKLRKCQQSESARPHDPNSFFNECNKVIDGEGRNHTSCTTIPQYVPWWQAETERLAYIKRVRIFDKVNPTDRVDRTGETYLLILVDDEVCHTYYSSYPFTVKVFPCHAVGRVVKIESSRPNFTLCEVEVFGRLINEDADSIPLSNCNQSSSFYDNLNTTCDNAIDGDMTSFASIGICSYYYAVGGWWRAETGTWARIKRVRLSTTVANNSLRSFAIKLDDYDCGIADYDPSPTKDFFCEAFARSITITSPSSCLYISVVQVFGDTRLKRRNEYIIARSCRPDYPTYSRYRCKRVPKHSPTGPLNCKLSGTYTLAGLDSVPLGYFDTTRILQNLTSLEFVALFRAMTAHLFYIRTVNIGLKRFSSSCYTIKFREFLIAVNGVPCASYSIDDSYESYNDTFIHGPGKNFTCNAIGDVVEIATRDPCTIDELDVTIYGEETRRVGRTTKEWFHSLCTKKYLKQLIYSRDYNRLSDE